jgi:hypothetical protein
METDEEKRTLLELLLSYFYAGKDGAEEPAISVLDSDRLSVSIDGSQAIIDLHTLEVSSENADCRQRLQSILQEFLLTVSPLGESWQYGECGKDSIGEKIIK